MKRTLTLFFAFVLMSTMVVLCQNTAQAAQTQSSKTTSAPYISPGLKPCIVKYKNGDYVGTIQDINELLVKEPDNMYAKYYLALSYTRLGYREKAENLYREISQDSSNLALQYYSQKAVDCLRDPEGQACKPTPKAQPAASNRPASNNSGVKNVNNTKAPEVKKDESDITQFIMSGKQFHPAAADRITRERMERKIQQEEYQKKQQEQDSKLKSDASSTLPTNEEIASALNTLSKIGMNPYQVNPMMTAQFNQYANPLMSTMLLGNNTNSANSGFAKMFLYSQMMQPQNNLLNYGI